MSSASPTALSLAVVVHWLVWASLQSLGDHELQGQRLFMFSMMNRVLDIQQVLNKCLLIFCILNWLNDSEFFLLPFHNVNYTITSLLSPNCLFLVSSWQASSCFIKGEQQNDIVSSCLRI